MAVRKINESRRLFRESYDTDELYMDWSHGMTVESGAYKTAQDLIDMGVPTDEIGSERFPLAKDALRDSVEGALKTFTRYLEGKASVSNVWSDADDIAKIADAILSC